MTTPLRPALSPAGPPAVVLGSGSPYRRELLSRLLSAFEVVVPQVDETRHPGEPPGDLAVRLARLKAERVARDRPEALVIGSDQVAECGGEILGKPGSAERAIAQLTRCAGRQLFLHTAVCVIGPAPLAPAEHRDETVLQFRALTHAEIASYVSRDRPLDCAGSFKFESLGAALFTEARTLDPTAIQGLPLLWLAGVLARFGVPVL